METHITHQNSVIHTGSGIRISILQYQPTTRPIEDRFSIDGPEDRLVVGVYDGHGGSATADHVSKVLPRRILRESVEQLARVFQDLDSAMLQAFTEDHDQFRTKSKEWAHNAHVLKAGCTALVLDIDTPTLTVTSANAGDCRAVIWGPSSKEAQETVDLNAKAPSEQARLKLEHPNEDNVVVGGRLFGKLMATRGFGDGYYKLPVKANTRLHRKYVDTFSGLEQKDKVPMNAQYDTYFYGYQSPPYMTAAPHLRTFKLEKGGFILLATDGLWDLVESELAVKFVQQGIDGGRDDLSKYVLQRVMETKTPGDDVTVIVLRA